MVPRERGGTTLSHPPASSDDAPYALGLLIFGSGLVTVGVVLPRLRNAEVGPTTGFKLTLDEQRALSTELAEAPGWLRCRATRW